MTVPAFTITEGGTAGAAPGYRWRCTTCGTVFRWSAESSSFGTLDDAEAVFCSAACEQAWTPPAKAGRCVFPVYQVTNDGRVIIWGDS